MVQPIVRRGFGRTWSGDDDLGKRRSMCNAINGGRVLCAVFFDKSAPQADFSECRYLLVIGNYSVFCFFISFNHIVRRTNPLREQ